MSNCSQSTCDFNGTKNVQSTVIESLKLFQRNVSDFCLPVKIAILNEIPEPFEFYRNWVAKNIPVLIKGGIQNWPALKKWNKQYFCEKFKDKKISVAVTPNGYADAITETVLNEKTTEVFVLPEERLMTISDFLNKLDAGLEFSDLNVRESKGIFYIQKQNSNLAEEFSELLPDIDEHLLWASETFQSKPTAINLWIGDKRAVTSLHKDPFENIYCVISGCKEFTLLPPTDRPWLPYKKVHVGQYKETSPGVFEINMLYSDKWMTKCCDEEESEDGSFRTSDTDGSQIQWIAIDPSSPDYKKYPLYKHASPIKVRVEQGDMLYLPSLWFHHVTQSHKCIAVNYWYDMSIDIKYAYFQLLDSLTNLCDIGS